MADGPSLGTAYLRVAGDFSQVNSQLVGLVSPSKMGKLGKAAGVALAGGLVAGGALKGLYEIGQAFDDASDKIRVTTGKSGKELAKLERSFKNVVSGVPADFDSASTAVADLNQRLGLTGRPLQRLSKQMLELSRITETDVGTNVQSITRLFGDWSIKTGKQTKTLDKLFRTSQATGIGVSDLSDLMVQFGSPLRQLGLDFETSAAMFARFEKEGVNIQTLMPGLRMALKNFSAPTDDLTASFDKLGISLKEGPSAALQEVFEALERAPSDLKANALAFEVFGARAGPDMAAAVREGRFELDELMRTIAKGDETIRKAGRETMDFGEHWQKLKNNVFVALEPVAKRVFGTLGDEMKRVTDILTDKSLSKDEKFTAILDRIQHLAEKWGPKIAEAGAKLGISLIKGIAGAFVDSSILGKLFIGAAVFKLFGGKALIAAGGKSMGKVLGRGMVLGVLLALPLLLPEAWKLGKKIGEKISEAMGGPIRKAIEALKDKFGDLMDTLTNSRQFDVQDVGGLKAATARLIEKYGTDLESVIADLAKVGVGRKRAGEAIMRALRDQDLPKIDTKGAEKSFDRIDERAKQSGKGWDRYSEGVGQNAQKATGSTGRHADRSRDDLKRIDDALGKTRGVTDKYASGADKNFGKVTTESGRMKTGVSKNVGGLSSIVTQGLQLIGDNTNKALKAFGVKQIGLSLAKAGKTAGNLVGLQRGGITPVPGRGNGDTVPAMLEPGEVVINKKAVSAMGGAARLDSINRKWPRFAGGGVAKSGGMTAMMALANKYEAASYPYLWGGGHGGFPNGSSPVDCSGFVSDVLHAGGLLDGAPMVSGALMGWGKPASGNEPVVVYANDGHTVMSLNGKVAGTSSTNPGDGAGWIAGASGASLAPGAKRTMDVAGAIASKIKRVLLEGPNGVMKDYGQAALDRAWKGANAFLSKQMPSGSFGGGDIGSGSAKGINSAAEFIPFWNQINPDAQQFASAFSKIVPAESGWNPRANNGSHAGWYQFDSPTWSDFGKGGWPEGPYDPALATGAAGNVARQEGWGGVQSRWAATYAGKQLGGIVQKLAKGTKGNGAKKTDGPWSHEQMPRGVNALQAALKAQKKIGRLGRAIGMQDERIDIADRLASLDSSPAGSELSAFERNELLDLNTTLLRKLAATGALSMQGLRLTERGMKNASGSTLSRLKGLRGTFKDSYTDTLGLTGESGRLFDTKLNLRSLRNTPLGSAATAEARAGLLAEQLAGLQGQLGVSQSQYGVFGDYFPRFHGGGMVPGPLGQERPIVAAGGERILTPEQQQMMVEPVIYADIYVGGEKIDERVDVRLRKVAKQTARRVPTGRI